MNFTSVLAGPGGLMLVLAVVMLGLNAYSYWIYNGVKNLVVRALEEHDGLAGDHTVATYTRLLFGEVMRGKFFTPSGVVAGNPANDRVYRGVERSQEFARLKELASFLRDVPPPIHLIPYCV